MVKATLCFYGGKKLHIKSNSRKPSKYIGKEPFEFCLSLRDDTQYDFTAMLESKQLTKDEVSHIITALKDVEKLSPDTGDYIIFEYLVNARAKTGMYNRIELDTLSAIITTCAKEIMREEWMIYADLEELGKEHHDYISASEGIAFPEPDDWYDYGLDYARSCWEYHITDEGYVLVKEN